MNMHSKFFGVFLIIGATFQLAYHQDWHRPPYSEEQFDTTLSDMESFIEKPTLKERVEKMQKHTNQHISSSSAKKPLARELHMLSDY